MTAFTFSIEQLRTAPREVRSWVANEIARGLAAVGGRVPEMPGGEPRRPAPMSLAACSVPEAARLFEMIGGDAVVLRVFFELARENSLHTNRPGINALQIADLLHHSGLAGRDGLAASLSAIDRAFRQVHGDDDGSLFGVDDGGHVYLQEATQASIRRVWAELVQARAAAEREATPEPAPEPAAHFEGFVPAPGGAGEDIAARVTAPLPGSDRPF